ncbi:MAG: response regulator [Syntrophobacter sp.]
MKKKIIFVGDLSKKVKGFQKMLRGMSHEWETTFAESGSETLETLGKGYFHVLISDVHLSDMSVCDLLESVRKLHPHVVRIILALHSDHATAIKSVAPAHQCLLAPCDPETLKEAVGRALAMRALLDDQSLVDIISGMESLPSLPLLYTEVVREVNSPTCSLNRVGEIISRDVGMSAKILQVANSAFYGHSKQVSSLVGAILFLGIETIKALILSVKVFSSFGRVRLPGFSITGLWDHSISTGMNARSIATQKDLAQGRIDEAFVAGLLHDVGKLILLDRLPEKCLEIAEVQKSSGCPIWEAEKDVLGTTHAQVGAYLMGIWGLPESIVEAIAYHHCPGKCANRGFSTLTAVHLADSLAHGETPGNSKDRLDHEYLANLANESGPDS